MSLLHQIQEAVVQEDADLASILLKLRLLAARLGSDILEEWVKHETEGYPPEVEIPNYRIIPVSYKGTFYGAFNSGIQNAPIPSHLIEMYASKSWTNYQMRGSIAAVDELIKSSKDGGGINIDASNLILLLQGKIYEDYSCNSVKGTMSRSNLLEIKQAVRSRILELTLGLEKSIPEASRVTFGAPIPQATNLEKVQQISQQIIYGNVTTAVAGGHGSSITVNVTEGDSSSLAKCLEASGLPNKDASEFAEIIASERPETSVEPFGQKAKDWIAGNIKKAADGTWKMGISVATSVLTEAAMKYYGLK